MFNEPVSGILQGGSSCYISIYRDGQLVTQLDWIDQADEYSLYFQPKNMADVENWVVGDYRFVLYLDDEVIAERSTRFFNTRGMKVLAVPIITNYQGRIEEPTGLWQTGGTMIAATFPVAKANIEFVLGPPLDMSYIDIVTDEGMYEVWREVCNLQTRNKDYEVIIGFIPYGIPSDGGTVLGYTYELPGVIASEDDPEMLATVIHEIAHGYKVGDEYEGGSMNLAVNSPPYRMEGHCIISQRDVEGEKPNVQGGQDIGLNGTGSVIYPGQRPFYVEGRRLLTNTTSYMGGGADNDPFEMWVTSDIWIHKFNALFDDDNVGRQNFFESAEQSGGVQSGGLQPSGGQSIDGHTVAAPPSFVNSDSIGQCLHCFMDIGDEIDLYAECFDCGVFTYVTDFDDGDMFGCANCYEEEYIDEHYLYIDCFSCDQLNYYPSFISHNRQSRTSDQAPNLRTAEPTEVLAVEIRGHIDRDGSFTAYPWYTFISESANLDNFRSGEYAVYFLDSNGKQLAMSYFDAKSQSQIFTSEGNRFVSQERIPVDFTVRYPENTARIEVKKGDALIHSTTVSRTAPTVSFTGLTDHQELGNNVTLTWEARGEKDLFFEIWYSPAEEEFHLIASDVTGRSFLADLSSLPGTDEGYFYIYATDGVRTGEAASEWVKVPFKAPEIISSQDIVPEYKITEEILFDADIYDMQDGWLWDVDEVVWTLGGREFMSGSYLWVWPYELAPESHTFTVTATNSAGLSSQSQFTFRIIDDESDLPNDWSREDIKAALSYGFAVDLRRIDAPITRGGFAALMATMYGAVSEEDDPYPYYIEGVVTDGGNDDYDMFLMVHLGVMDAPGGRFNPRGTLTEQEATLIMYRVAELADPDWFGSGADDEDILEFLYDLSAIEHSGENTLRSNEPLTNKLALVRLSRLYSAVFE